MEPYIKLIKRNERDIYDRIIELVKKHIDRVEGSETFFTQEEQINAVVKYYKKAIDFNNPNQKDYQIEQEMHGRIRSHVNSYNLMDN